MPDYTYLIIGGGMTGDAAVHGIREVDRTRLYRRHRQRIASTLQPPASLQGALERQTLGQYLSQG